MGGEVGRFGRNAYLCARKHYKPKLSSDEETHVIVAIRGIVSGLLAE